MNFYEREQALLNKMEIFREQNGICPVCNKGFNNPSEIQAAHRVCKSKVNIKKYTPEVIHHKFNIACTHDVCNSAVLVNPETQTGKDLIERIKEDLLNGC